MTDVSLAPDERRILKLEIVEATSPSLGHSRFEFAMIYDDADFYKLCCALRLLASDMFENQVSGTIRRPDKSVNALHRPAETSE